MKSSLSGRSPGYLRTGRRQQLEHEAQVQVIEWADLVRGKYPELRWLFAVPNGGARHPAVAAKLKAEGVRRGVPDLVLPLARGGFHGLYLEMKSEEGRATDHQREWADYLAKGGYAYCLARGFDAAKAFLVAYLEGRVMECA